MCLVLGIYTKHKTPGSVFIVTKGTREDNIVIEKRTILRDRIPV